MQSLVPDLYRGSYAYETICKACILTRACRRQNATTYAHNFNLSVPHSCLACEPVRLEWPPPRNVRECYCLQQSVCQSGVLAFVMANSHLYPSKGKSVWYWLHCGYKLGGWCRIVGSAPKAPTGTRTSTSLTSKSRALLLWSPVW